MPPRRRTRRQLTCALVAILVIGVGLAARHLRSTSPSFVTAYLGDTLWPVLFFLAFAIARPRATTRTLAVLTLVTTLAIEVSQLYHAPWIDGVRATAIGRLMLGNTFLWSDVVCILVGTTAAAVVDRRVSPSRD